MKTKIVIAGIGGVGGYFGGLLAYYFYNSKKVEICFIARGNHLKEIKKNGLTVIDEKNNFIVKPHLATDNPSEIGIADFLIIATKSYDLELIIEQLQPCINQNTIVLPLLNGVNNADIIRELLPKNIVLDGCTYIVSRLKQAGVIENTGKIQKLYFGLDNFENDRLLLLENLFKQANIEAYLSKNISTIIWEKFIFISAVATATSYFNQCIGALIDNQEKVNTITLLMEEVKQIAQAKNIYISENIIDRTLHQLKRLPFETTSSMHSDFLINKQTTELDSLTGYVVTEGQKYHLETPLYLKFFSELKQRGCK
jgi:2-dehydropantoate 2-reductase